jgi:hypothetical protein
MPGGVTLQTPATKQQSRFEMRNEMMHSPAWKQLYEIALIEGDPNKLPKRFAEARHAILDRVEELLTGPSTWEHRALKDAFQYLRSLQNNVPGNDC